jgi:hypothetical protein
VKYLNSGENIIPTVQTNFSPPGIKQDSNLSQKCIRIDTFSAAL